MRRSAPGTGFIRRRATSFAMARAREWYCSPEYAGALAVSRRALRRRLIFVDGVPPG